MKRTLTAALAVTVHLLLPAGALGASRYWDVNAAANLQGGSSTWQNGGGFTNWAAATDGSGRVVWPGTGNSAIFRTNTGGGPFTVTVNTTQLVDSICFENTGDLYTVSGGTQLTLGNGAKCGICVNATSATISTVIGGTQGLLKTGTGTLILLTATNTYSGGTTINAGTIQVGDGTTLSTFNASAFGTGTVTVNSGTIWLNPKGTASPGTVFNLANSFSVNGGTIRGEDDALHLATGGGATFAVGASGATVQSTWGDKTLYIDGTLTGSTTLAIGHGATVSSAAAMIHITNAANSFSGTVTVTPLGSGAGNDVYLIIDNNSALTSATVNLVSASGGTPYMQITTASPTIAGLTSSAGVGIVNTKTVAGTYTLNVNNAVNNTFGGVLANNTGTLALTKSGTATLTLSGTNTYTGGTTVSAGILQAGNAQAFGNTGVIITVNNGGTIDLAGYDLRGYTANISINGQLDANNGAIINSGAAQLNAIRQIALGSDAYIGNNGHRIDFGRGYTGAVRITGNNHTLYKIGTDTIGFLGQATTLTALVINGGYIQFEDNASFGTAPITVNSGAFLLSYDARSITNAITMNNGNINADGAGGSTFGGTMSLTNTNYFGNSGGFAGNSFTISGVISGTGAMTKQGTGTLTLSAVNTLSGAVIVNGGTLVLGSNNTQYGTIGTAVPTLTINNGGTVSVPYDNGIVGFNAANHPTITINSGGVLTSTGTASAHLPAVTLNGGTLTTAANINSTWGNWNLDYGVTTPGNASTSTISASAGGTFTLGQTGGTVFNVGAGDNLNVSAVIAHAGSAPDNGLIKSGTGTMTLSGTNTYTGATTVSAGTIKFGNTQALGNYANTITVNNGGALDANSIQCNLYTGTITINGQIDANTGCLYNSGTWVWNTNGQFGKVALGSDASVGGAGGRFDVGRTMASAFTGNNHTLTKVGADTLGIPSPSATLTGLVINGGVVQFDVDGAFASGTVTINSGTKLVYFQTRSISNNLIMSSGNLETSLETPGNIGTFSGTVSLTGSNTFAANSMVLSGVISGTGALTMSGAGTLTLSNTSNSYAGDNTISSGTLKLGAANVIPDGSGKGNVSLTGSLDLASFSETINGLSGAGTVTSSTAAATPVLTEGNNDQTSTFSGSIVNGSATSVGLTKTGAGTLTLSGTASTYSGATTVGAGTLMVTNGSGSATGTSTVGVSSGAVLAGTGYITGAITMNNGSTLAPGTGGTTIGTLHTGAVTFSTTSTYSVDLNHTGLAADQISSSSTVALGTNANTLTVASITGSANGDVYTIIAATTSVTGTFSGLPDGTTFVVSDRLLRINYNAGPKTVTLTDVSTGPNAAWSQTGLGQINGGAIADTKIFLGTTTPNAIIGRNLTNGSSAWSFTTGITGGCGMPTYSYIGGAYVILASFGTKVVGVHDDGTQHFAATDIGGTAGTPYISPDNTNFFVTRPGFLSKRLVSNGSQVAGWDVAVTNISTLADPVVYSDFVYVATTDGKVHMGDAADFTPLTTYQPATLTGVSINLPLMVSGSTLYITPNNGTLHAVTTSAMTATKTLVTYAPAANNSGPAFSDIDITNDTVYTAAGVNVYQIKDVAGGQKNTYAALGPVNSGPIPLNNSVYFGANGGYYYALNKANFTLRNTTVIWPYNRVTGNATSGPWIDFTNNRVIFGSTGGNLTAFALEP